MEDSKIILFHVKKLYSEKNVKYIELLFHIKIVKKKRERKGFNGVFIQILTIILFINVNVVIFSMNQHKLTQLTQFC